MGKVGILYREPLEEVVVCNGDVTKSKERAEVKQMQYITRQLNVLLYDSRFSTCFPVRSCFASSHGVYYYLL